MRVLLLAMRVLLLALATSLAGCDDDGHLKSSVEQAEDEDAEQAEQDEPQEEEND